MATTFGVKIRCFMETLVNILHSGKKCERPGVCSRPPRRRFGTSSADDPSFSSKLLSATHRPRIRLNQRPCHDSLSWRGPQVPGMEPEESANINTIERNQFSRIHVLASETQKRRRLKTASDTNLIVQWRHCAKLASPRGNSV